MKDKTIAIIIVVIVVAAGIYFASKPVMKAPASQKQEQPAGQVGEQPASPLESKETPAEQAYQDFLKWKADNSPTTQVLDDRLGELAAQFPADYRFSLERVRGSANIKGVHSHAEEFEILEEAAAKAIACKCGDAAKMLADLQANKDRKTIGFWKLSTHPRQWDVVVEALEKEDAALLEKSKEHHH